MTAFRINDDEQKILKSSELSHPAKILYMLGVRPHMDFKTAIVGKERRISYQGLHEVLEFIPLPGSKRPKADFSIKAIRCLVDELEKIGLVRRLPNDHRALFLECLVADREDAPKNRKGRGRAERKGTGGADLNANNDGGFSDSDDCRNGRPKDDRRGTPPVSGKPICTPQAAALLNVPVDNFAALRFEEIVIWLKTMEKRRGKIVAVVAADRNIKSWVSRDVQADELREAHAMAVADREKQNNPAPIHVGFLNLFIERVMSRRKPWFSTWSGIVAKGSEHGLTQSPNEQNHEFKRRVFAAAGMSEEEARQWQA